MTMMRAENFSQNFKIIADLVSRWSAVLFAFFLPLSTGLMDSFFILAAIGNILAGNWRQKWHSICQIRVALACLLLFFLFIICSFYSTGNGSDILLTLKKYSHLLLGISLLPLFIESRWRHRAINAFLVAMFIVTIMSYLTY